MKEKPLHRIGSKALTDFCVRVMEKLNVSSEDAAIVADSLVAADLRGISTHGVARLRFYMQEMQAGIAKPNADVHIVRETPTTALIDGNGGLGQPISKHAMHLAIQKAQKNGISFVAVRNSNHYGTAGYYSMMALEYDMIGISMTNSFALVAPTFGSKAMLGTNPISMAAPAGQEYPFVLDMSTSAVTFGKVENYERFEKPLPEGWAIDERGNPAVDAGRTVHLLDALAGGALLPLGGLSELYGGHKGYGLAMMVDILSGILSGGGYADNIYPIDENGHAKPSNVSHFFGAVHIESFRPLDDFKASMDDMIQRLKSSPKMEGQDRIYIHGEKEFELENFQSKKGIGLHPKVMADLKKLSQDLDIEFNL